MVKYSCVRCGKEFTQKSHHDTHAKRKTLCENNADKIKQLVNDAVDEKMRLMDIKKMNNAEINNNHMATLQKCSTNIQKPFLKWVGGKTQIIEKVMTAVPVEFDDYHELFLGGGSVLLSVLSHQKQKKITIKGSIYAYDINGILIDTYKDVQRNKDALFMHITKYMDEYGTAGTDDGEAVADNDANDGEAAADNDANDGEADAVNNATDNNATATASKINRNPKTVIEARESKESYYYWMRQQFNKYVVVGDDTTERSALFMILNKTCFRGIYREGPNGFNVPFGHYKTTPCVISSADLNNISDLIKDVQFMQGDFADSIENIKLGDFVYLDPPYAPNAKNAFVGYTADGFDLDKHKKLFASIDELNNQKIKFVMSNAKTPLVMNAFKGYKCIDIKARRAINSKRPDATAMEVLISN